MFLDNSEVEFMLMVRQGHRENTRTGFWETSIAVRLDF